MIAAAGATSRATSSPIDSVGSPFFARRCRRRSAASASHAIPTTASIQPTTSEKNVEVSPVIVGSVMFSVPVVPSTFSCAPCQVSRPASVTTKVGIDSRVATVPWKNPIASAAREPDQQRRHRRPART